VYDRYSTRFLQVGDLIRYTSPSDPGRYVRGRIVGRGGDTVNPKARYRQWSAIVPSNNFWVEAETEDYEDSNIFGAVPLGLVDSRVLYSTDTAFVRRKITKEQRRRVHFRGFE